VQSLTGKGKRKIDWKTVRKNTGCMILDRPASVDFPTPPFAEETAITFLTSFIALRSGNPRCMRGILPLLGRPCMVFC
jgi:hypothetical protein